MYEKCSQFGFDQKKIEQRLAFLRLSKADHRLAQRLNTEVIRPNLTNIIDRFYETLLFHSQSRQWLMDGDTIQSLKKTQGEYLLSLGIHFDQAAYFEERLRIGVMHAVIGLPLSIYLGAYSNLIQYIIDVFPSTVKDDPRSNLALIDFIIKITSLDITLATETYHFSYMNDLQVEIVSAKNREEQFRSLSETDSLTGLHNRKHSFSLLNEAIQQAHSTDSGFCLLMLDIDYFKKVNDSYGHQSGDEVLIGVAEIIRQSLRNQDIAGRYGGEEFIIGLTDTRPDVARQIAERLRRILEETMLQAGGNKLSITVSIGAAQLVSGDNLAGILQRADEALYSAKAAGRNNVIFA